MRLWWQMALINQYTGCTVQVSFALLVVVNCVGVATVQHVFGVGRAHLPLNLAAAMVMYILYSAYQVRAKHQDNLAHICSSMRMETSVPATRSSICML